MTNPKSGSWHCLFPRIVSILQACQEKSVSSWVTWRVSNHRLSSLAISRCQSRPTKGECVEPWMPPMFWKRSANITCTSEAVKGGGRCYIGARNSILHNRGAHHKTGAKPSSADFRVVTCGILFGVEIGLPPFCDGRLYPRRPPSIRNSARPSRFLGQTLTGPPNRSVTLISMRVATAYACRGSGVRREPLDGSTRIPRHR